MSLTSLVELHRAAYRDELNVSRMVSRQPPTSLDVNTGMLHEEEATRIGMNMSGSLLRRLGHPEGFGSAYPWMRSLWLLRVECRRRHPHHRSAERPYWRGSLCHQAAKLVIIGGEVHGHGPLTIQQASKVLRVDKMEPLLRNAFRIIEETIDDFRRQADRRRREEDGYSSVLDRPPTQQRHDQPGMHQADCRQCIELTQAIG